jgi:hypothetical protein
VCPNTETKDPQNKEGQHATTEEQDEQAKQQKLQEPKRESQSKGEGARMPSWEELKNVHPDTLQRNPVNT